MSKDEMVGWHRQLNGHEFRWTPGVGDGQGGLVCCGSWGHKELDTTEWLNWTELNWKRFFIDVVNSSFLWCRSICRETKTKNYRNVLEEFFRNLSYQGQALAWVSLLLLLLSRFSRVRHRQQPTRLPRPWDSPGKNTGVGCQFLLQCRKVKSKSEVAQPCPTLSDPMDYSLPGSSVHGIFQARVLEWGAIAFSGLSLKRYHYYVIF